mgnify:FL=1
MLATEEGVDRAFAKLDEIKPHVTSWWSAGAQPVQMLSDGEVAFTTAWNGRITQLKQEGVPVDTVWNGGAIKPSYVAIIKGTEHKKAAEQYINFMIGDPKRSAEFAAMVAYPGMTKGLYDHIDPAVGREMPTHPDNVDLQFVVDAVFWAKHQEKLQERWQEWMLE